MRDGVNTLLKWFVGACTLYLFWALFFQPPEAQDVWQKAEKRIAPEGGGDFWLEIQQPYSLDALIIQKKRYTDDWSHISPYDIVMGWGSMLSMERVKNLEISQWERRYFWVLPPEKANLMSLEEIKRGTANVHVLAGNPQAMESINQLKPGDLVRLTGYLVNIHRKDGQIMKTSLTREDSGDGACEIFLVEKIASL